MSGEVPTRFRYRTYNLLRDGPTLPKYTAECVGGDDAVCGAVSGEWADQRDVDRWAAAHVAESGHLRFRRSFHDYVEVEAAEPPASTRPARSSG
ncbi:hypothetical protein GXW83_26970 [Streptacidiphilus sp. PB12-B1b]|uniref:DUF7848 domain-containing protein n=1 Tax=Streptacidiphilus sp. PB12-B1b TaxID=2705012 RepID=UPI0015FAF8FB|nr:hypothetical protein [Streptacidiphilus sp. PB12-B1b]QMU78804.1 hypothetical protein GXW83_26970 [Streptacidiphilus sp. PB12-B1b]